jgi:ferredoxin--NADP+ reductase
VPDGPLTSRLQHLRAGDPIVVSKKPTGTLVLHDLNPGKHLYLLATGTGLAPFLSVIQDPETYERFEKVVLVHGVRFVSELAYTDFITRVLPQNEFFGEQVREQLIYYPTVTREPFRNTGRITHVIESGKPVRRHRPAGARSGARPGDDLRQPGDEQGLLRPARRARLRDVAAHRRGRATT